MYLLNRQAGGRVNPRLVKKGHVRIFVQIRKAISARNAIESVNMSLRKITKNRGSFRALRR